MIGQVRTEIGTLGASIEMLPGQVPAADKLSDLLPRGTRVYLTDIGAAGAEEEMLKAARRLTDGGFVPVPHLAARRIFSEALLERRIGGLAEQAGVRDVLVIGGGVKPAVGPFPSTIALLETGFLDRYGITDLGIAGHPEGTPDFSESVANEALLLKQAFAKRTGAKLRIVTQFGFDAKRAITWAEGLHGLGITAPIHMGIAGPAKISTLIKYGTLCGVGNSLSMLTRHAGNFMMLATGYSPDTFIAPIEKHLSAANVKTIVQMHVFPFGGLEKAAAWLKGRGSW